MAKTYNSKAMAALHENASDLYRLGLIDKKTMQRFDRSSLTPVKMLTPAAIRLKKLERFFKEVAGLTVKHEVVAGAAVVYPSALGKALKRVDSDWYRNTVDPHPRAQHEPEGKSRR